MEELTAKEEEVMQVIWNLERALVRDIMGQLPNSKQPYTTVASIVRILEKKGFVDHRSFGKSHQYYHLISREQYRNERLSSLMKNYFNNSMKQALSYFGKSDNMNLKEADDIIQMMEELKRKAGDNE